MGYTLTYRHVFWVIALVVVIIGIFYIQKDTKVGNLIVSEATNGASLAQSCLYGNGKLRELSIAARSTGANEVTFCECIGARSEILYPTSGLKDRSFGFDPYWTEIVEPCMTKALGY